MRLSQQLIIVFCVIAYLVVISIQMSQKHLLEKERLEKQVELVDNIDYQHKQILNELKEIKSQLDSTTDKKRK